MAMPKETKVHLGKLNVTLYDFAKTGDKLPTHTHGEADNHITVVAKGSIKIIDHPDLDGQIFHEGKVIDWAVGVPHGFVALEDNTRVVNVVKG
jgi:quercetin dioxygenase-like cupin family protein